MTQYPIDSLLQRQVNLSMMTIKHGAAKIKIGIVSFFNGEASSIFYTVGTIWLIIKVQNTMYTITCF